MCLPPPGSVRLLILDCDGVLIRSERANLAYYNHIFTALGLPAVADTNEAALHRLHTLSTPQVIDHFFPAEERAAARRFAGQVPYTRFAELLDGEPGWPEVLGSWPGRIAVATNRGTSARPILQRVGVLEYVDLVVTVHDVPRPKPSPDMLLKVLESLGEPADAALYVGDSELDREAAAAAGVAFLGFRTGQPPCVDSAAAAGGLLRGLALQPGSATLPRVSV